MLQIVLLHDQQRQQHSWGHQGHQALLSSSSMLQEVQAAGPSSSPVQVGFTPQQMAAAADAVHARGQAFAAPAAEARAFADGWVAGPEVGGSAADVAQAVQDAWAPQAGGYQV